MKDVFKSYYKHKVLSQVSLVTLSLVLAIGINMFVFSSPKIEGLKASVLETPNIEASEVDFTAFTRENQLIFQTHSLIQDMKEFSFSLAYDPDVLSLGTYTTSLPASNISELRNESGFVTYIMTFDTPIELQKNSEILSLSYTKLQEKTAYINPVQINFKDSTDEIFLLSTKQLMY